MIPRNQLPISPYCTGHNCWYCDRRKLLLISVPRPSWMRTFDLSLACSKWNCGKFKSSDNSAEYMYQKTDFASFKQFTCCSNCPYLVFLLFPFFVILRFFLSLKHLLHHHKTQTLVNKDGSSNFSLRNGSQNSSYSRLTSCSRDVYVGPLLLTLSVSCFFVGMKHKNCKNMNSVQ